MTTLSANCASGRGIFVYHTLASIPMCEFEGKMGCMLLAVCIKGEFAANVDFVERRLNAGSIMVLFPGHTVTSCRQSNGFEGFYIMVKRDSLETLIPSLRHIVPSFFKFRDNPVVEVTDSEMTNQCQLFRLLGEKLAHPDRPFFDSSISALCEVLFFDTLAIYQLRMKKVSHTLSRREELVTGFFDLLDNQFLTQRSVTYYAQQLCITTKHLSAVIKDVTGYTSSEWIDRRVTLEAKRLLSNTTKNIQEISLYLNFANQSFFGKFFKKCTGLSPRQFRSTFQANNTQTHQSQ